ncbi:FadR/GntR family transcriptional regulator [Sulfitobacter sp.]|uniref:FadR/GntR family transcriptional regulator n=1 Tax=Sulfitobacter sp. TaxID=1903071 RepID=UPI0030013284
MSEPDFSRVSDGLYLDVLAGILMGDYPPQSRLPPETSLARDYGVSRTIVRSALEQLKNQGLVQSRQGSGTVVASFDPKALAKLNRDAQLPALKDCYACRLAIEPSIAGCLAGNLTEEVSAFLHNQRAILDAAEEGNPNQNSAEDAEFHIQLAWFSRNRFFIATMNTLRPHMLFAMNISKMLTNRAQQRHYDLSQEEHLDIINSILTKDPQIAQDAMRAHIHKGRERIFHGYAESAGR